MYSRQTSREAFSTIREMGILSRRRLDVYEALLGIGPATATQVANVMPGRKSSSVGANVHARLGELVKMNLVREIKEAECPVTGMTVIYWDVKDPSGFKPFVKPESHKDKIHRLQMRIKDLEIELARKRHCVFCAP